MERINHFYESLFIVDVTGGEETVKASVDKFVGLIQNNAEYVIEVNEWGKRRLAYPINDKPEGYYVVVTFKSNPDFPAEFERLATIDETILRTVLIRLDFEPKPTAKAEPVVEAAPVEEIAPVVETADAE